MNPRVRRGLRRKDSIWTWGLTVADCEIGKKEQAAKAKRKQQEKAKAKSETKIK